jgi:hypothetical protein
MRLRKAFQPLTRGARQLKLKIQLLKPVGFFVF